MSLAMPSFWNFEDRSSSYRKSDSSYVTSPQFSMAVTARRGMAIWSGKVKVHMDNRSVVCLKILNIVALVTYVQALGQASPKFINEHVYTNKMKR